ncbi:MAG: hypothetical protein ACXWEF_04730 [Solirubrobacterales bacterium]
MPTMRRALLSVSLAAIAVCAVPAAASANTQIVGSALAKAYDGGVSTAAGTTTVQISEVGGTTPFPITSPANGVITDWAVRTSDDDTFYVLRVLTGASPTFTSVRRITAPSAIPAGTVDTIFHFPGNSTPISKDDHIGLLQEGNPDEGIAQAMSNGVPLDAFAFQTTAFPDGVGSTFTPDVQHELLLQATVKFCKVPDLVGKKPADATAALTTADCAAGAQTTRKLKLKKKTKKNRKKNKAIKAMNGVIVSQGTPPADTAVPGTAVAFEVGQLAKKKKKKKKK